MRSEIGKVAALFRYPVKSMGGERVVEADLGWHGVDGDRRLALRRTGEHGGFPWLTASRLPELLLFTPKRGGPDLYGNLPTHVRTPDGHDLDMLGPELATEIGRRHGAPVEMVHLNRGVFDEATISVMTSTTVDEIGRLSGQPADVRRFRPNILIASSRTVPFEEDDWVGGRLVFGDAGDAPAIVITNYDERCVMVNFEPESARSTPEVLKSIVQARDNKAGVYATVARRGQLTIGQPIFLER